MNLSLNKDNSKAILSYSRNRWKEGEKNFDSLTIYKKTLLSGKSVKWLKNWYNILIMNTCFLAFQK